MGLSKLKRPQPPAGADSFDAPRLFGTLDSQGRAVLARSKPTLSKVSEGSATPNTSSEESSVSPGGSSASVEVEDYDDLKREPATIVEGSHGGEIDEEAKLLNHNAFGPGRGDSVVDGEGESEDGVRPADHRKKSRDRRKSIQIKLERTDRKGRYLLTAEDSEIRDILRQGIERDASKSQQAKSRTRFRDLVFTRQFTTFDRQNLSTAESPFRGFFVLFWLCLVLLFVRVALHNWREYGSVVGTNEMMSIMFGRDVIVLGLTDGVICGSTAFGLVLHKMVSRGWVNWSRTGWIIQNVWQSFYLAAILGWTFYREWPWTHTVFIVLHTTVFLMKQHSYSFYNGYRRVYPWSDARVLLIVETSVSSSPSPRYSTESA